MSNPANPTPTAGPNFVRALIEEDLAAGKFQKRVITRFPPEPNGYLHIGHAKSICLNFGLAKTFSDKAAQSLCNLRFDDTNPLTEDPEFEASIENDVKWLGFTWDDRKFHASDYFEKLYGFAVELIKQGKAYVCDLNAEEIREYRGTLTQPGRNSPHRTRSVEENLQRFADMRAGKFKDGECTLRAKIDMASPNINMRDPALYRVRHATHHRTGDKWCIYPMYDYAHCLSDAIEKITHSICTLEFEDHRPLYDWILDQFDWAGTQPRQIEFARLNVSYTITSKRKLLELVKGKHVTGWDDPRMSTLQGLRRRGITPKAIRSFCEMIGVTKKDSCIDIGTLEWCVREDLNEDAPRAMCVIDPIKLVIENWEEGKVEACEAPVHPHHESHGKRHFNFTREVLIERDDFMEVPPKGYHRLVPGGEVRLRYGFIVKCEKVIKDAAGNVTELRCTYDPDTKSGTGTSTKKVKGVIHWISATDSLPCTVRLYDRLFKEEAPQDDFVKDLNPNSLQVFKNSRIEASVKGSGPEKHFQFERMGYFVTDRHDSKPDALVFNRVVTLKDAWAKEVKKG